MSATIVASAFIAPCPPFSAEDDFEFIARRHDRTGANADMACFDTRRPSIIALAPAPPSSAGWKMKWMVPAAWAIFSNIHFLNEESSISARRPMARDFRFELTRPSDVAPDGLQIFEISEDLRVALCPSECRSLSHSPTSRLRGPSVP